MADPMGKHTLPLPTERDASPSEKKALTFCTFYVNSHPPNCFLKCKCCKGQPAGLGDAAPGCYTLHSLAPDGDRTKADSLKDPNPTGPHPTSPIRHERPKPYT